MTHQSLQRTVALVKQIEWSGSQEPQARTQRRVLRVCQHRPSRNIPRATLDEDEEKEKVEDEDEEKVVGVEERMEGVGSKKGVEEGKRLSHGYALFVITQRERKRCIIANSVIGH